MPVNTPKDEKNSDVELPELEIGDEVKIQWQRSNGDTGTFVSEVTYTTTFDGGTEISLQSGKIYGDFYPPIVETPSGDEYRLLTINRT